MDREFSAKLNNVSKRIYAADNEEVPFTIEKANFNRRTGRLTATMRIYHGNGETREISLIGRIVKYIRVPVLLRRIKAGDIIRKSDIGWVELDARRVRDSFETDAESLINQQAVRSLSVGKPIRTRDIRSRVLVNKGSLATLILRTDRMLLTVKVLAMGDGSLGETVRVLNTRSKKTIEGIVTGAGQIIVPTLGLEQDL